MNFKLKVWRQPRAAAAGKFVDYQAREIPAESSFLEMLDIVNESLNDRNEDPIAFDSDCREGICGMCSLVIDGIPHGPGKAKTTCQLYMRQFQDGDTIWIEPFRAAAFPVIKDLAVDRSRLDRIIEVGGYISTRTGSAPEANSIPISKQIADLAMEAAACIGCGPAWRPVQILQRCFLSPPKFLILGYFLRANPSARVAQSKWFEPWTASASETVRTTTSVKPSARPRSAQLLFLGSIGITEQPP
jgi:succinate dehydrogenase/fumarate reductase-like Fe-S protein